MLRTCLQCLRVGSPGFNGVKVAGWASVLSSGNGFLSKKQKTCLNRFGCMASEELPNKGSPEIPGIRIRIRIVIIIVKPLPVSSHAPSSSSSSCIITTMTGNRCYQKDTRHFMFSVAIAFVHVAVCTFSLAIQMLMLVCSIVAGEPQHE